MKILAAVGLVPSVTPVLVDGQFGWLHLRQDIPIRRAGFVFCAPPGRDGRCAHRPLRELAQSLATLGFPILRIDPVGVGDSLDLDETDDAWTVWRRGAEAARDFLKIQTGVDKVVMTGLRIAGRLAAEVAADGLVLLAPVASGKTWLRELKLAAAMSGTAGAEGDLGLESEGLYFGSQTVQGLEGVDLAGLSGDWSHALVFAQNAQAKGVAVRLSGLGVETQVRDFPGFEDLLQDSHSNASPMAVFEEIMTWAQDTYPEIQHPRPANSLSAFHIKTAAFEEIAVNLGEGATAVLTRPPKASGLGVVICNTSREPRAGIGRLAVKVARNLANDGVTTLRFDFPGVGDSEVDCADHMYLADRTPDFVRAAEHIRRQGCTTIALVGVCSGAYHVIRAMSATSDFDLAYGVSSRLVWRKGDSLEPQFRDQGMATANYLGKLRDLATWRRLIQGDIDLLAVLRTLKGRLVHRLTALVNSRLGEPLRNSVAYISKRGGALRLVMGLEDSALDELETYFGSQARRLTGLPGMSMRVIPDLDHGVAKTASQDLVLADLRTFLKLT